MLPSRRAFIGTATLASGWSLTPGALAQALSTPLTVGAAIERIKLHVGIPWRAQTVDNLVAGNPDIHVKGIATTMMATFDVCKRAQALGCNFIVTHETPFYLHQDKIDDIRDNPVLKAKQAFLSEPDMAILHFHDPLHGMH